MQRLTTKLPRTIYVAVSGGIDSVAAFHYLSRNHNVIIAHVNHGTKYADKAESFVRDLASKYNVPLLRKSIKGEHPKGESQEAFWRKERYDLFHSISIPVVTAHHIEDAVETWVWSSLHGEGKIIPIKNKNVYRPFLLWSKQDFKRIIEKEDLEYIEDPSNTDTSYIRNHIRHNMMEDVLKVNPGINKVIRKKYLKLINSPVEV